MNEESNSRGGLGLMAVIFIIFLVMKLAHIGDVDDWSWWAVTAPLWTPTVLIIVILGFYYWAQYLKAKKVRKDIIAKLEKSDVSISNPIPKSKFQTRLEQAMAASEKAKEAKINKPINEA